MEKELQPQKRPGRPFGSKFTPEERIERHRAIAKKAARLEKLAELKRKAEELDLYNSIPTMVLFFDEAPRKGYFLKTPQTSVWLGDRLSQAKMSLETIKEYINIESKRL